MIDKLADLLENKLGVRVEIGILSKGGSVSLLPSGGSFYHRDLERGMMRKDTIQLLAKSKDARQAFAWCESAVSFFEGLVHVDVGGVRILKIECTTTTNLVEKDSDNQFLFTALFSVEYGG